MPIIRASKSAVIKAPPHVVYGIIADYKNGHPRIVPRQYFPKLEVVEGGVGGGTVLLIEMRAFGSTQRLRAEITEPIPGEVLLEAYPEAGIKTSFHVLPESSKSSRVVIITEWESPGVAGWVQWLVAPMFLRKIYAEELSNLASVAAELLPNDASK